MLLAASRAVTVRTLLPGCRAMPGADQVVVPEAVPLPPWLLVQETWVTPTLSAAEPPRVSGVALVEKVEPEVGVVMLTVGAVVSGAAEGTARVAAAVLLAASRAGVVRTLLPGCRAMLGTDQGVVPEAVPMPPWQLARD